MIFTQNPLIVVGIPALIMIWTIKVSIFNENIKIEIENTTLRHFENKKLKNEYNLEECYAGYQSKSTNGEEDYLYLLIHHKDEEHEIKIDCTPLGIRQFQKLYDDVELQAIKKKTKLETKKLKTNKKTEEK